MDPVALEKAFQKYPNVKAVVVVHLYGNPARIREIREICDKYNVALIEDAAESLGATYAGKQVGTFGECGIYSFNGNKIITTSTGGMIISNDKYKTEKVKFWATQSREKEIHYEHKEVGYNYRMSNVLAGIGRGQLKVIERRIDKKKKIFDVYKVAFKDIEEISMQPIHTESEPNYWLSTIILKKQCQIKPLDIIHALEKYNIESRPIWKPMHLQPIFKDYDFISLNEVTSVSEDIFNRGVCLPSDTKMTNEDQQKIIDIIKNILKNKKRY